MPAVDAFLAPAAASLTVFIITVRHRCNKCDTLLYKGGKTFIKKRGISIGKLKYSEKL